MLYLLFDSLRENIGEIMMHSKLQEPTFISKYLKEEGYNCTGFGTYGASISVLHLLTHSTMLISGKVKEKQYADLN